MTTAKEKTKRNVAIRVLVTPEIKRRLDVLADEYGLPVSTLAANYIGVASAEDYRGMNLQREMVQDVKKNLTELAEREMKKQIGQQKLFQKNASE